MTALPTLADLGELIATVQQPHLQELLERLLGEGTETGAKWREAPAAKVYHQAYRHGLLEHSLSVAQGVSAMASTFPGIDRDVAITPDGSRIVYGGSNQLLVRRLDQLEPPG